MPRRPRSARRCRTSSQSSSFAGSAGRRSLIKRVDQLFDRRFELLGHRRVPSAAAGRSFTRRMPRVPVASLLLVGSPLIRNREPGVWRSRPPRHRCPAPRRRRRAGRCRRSPLCAHALGRRDLRREDPFRVARSTAVQLAVTHRAREERRHAIEVRREHDVRSIDGREDIEPSPVDRLLDDQVAERCALPGKPAPGLRLAARSSNRCRSARARTRAPLPYPFFQGRSRARLLVAVLDDDGSGDRQAATPCRGRTGSAACRARRLPLGHDERLSRSGLDDGAVGHVVDGRRRGQDRARRPARRAS